ncbi:hypothetical protein [Phytoactinopolyspora halotolerans]|uniref:hypothetical protein n=1 Tax=Phytoactinopolyspora halotolerans TaxID=1981512 RepID=UPI001C209004|nr:hypothetical protein [Phytoactinopolyspora halotolerans]
MASDREFGDGPLARGAAAVYHALVLEFLLVLASSPGLVLLFSLVPDRSNIPLAALALVPLGPALSATVFAWRAVLTKGGLEPARHFWRGYRLNALAVLRWWVPALAVLALLGIDVAYLDAVGALDGTARAVLGLILVLLAVVVMIVAMHALVVTSLFELRTRDALRLALHHAGRFPLATLGLLSLALLALGVVALTSDWVLVLLGAVFALLLLHNAKPIITDIEENFTA